MDTEEIIKEIVNRVLNKLKEKEKQALVLFTGGALGFNESLDQLVKLRENGWNLKVVLSRGAENFVKKNLLKKKLSLDEVYLESENTGLYSLYQNTSILIIPTLTMNSAAKISLGISDNLTTNLASRFIMEGLPIIAAADACNPEHPYRVDLGKTTIPPSYIKMFHQYLDRLKEFGIKLVRAKDLEKAVLQYDQKSVIELEQKEKTKAHNRRKKVITKAEVMKAKEAGVELIVFENSIITALAKETAEIEDVQLVRPGE